MPHDRAPGDARTQRFATYLTQIAAVTGHQDRVTPFQLYTTGLLLPGERKSVEPMAARLAPTQVRRMHQSLHHLVADAPWSDRAVLTAVRTAVLPALARRGPVTAWIIDDTGFPKKGVASVGVSRQYCGQVGKKDNCRVAVSLSVTTGTASLPIAYDLYLPESWTDDPARCQQAGVPATVGFQTKPTIALAQVRQALADGVPRAPVLADAAYGTETAFRDEIRGMELDYAVGISEAVTVWAPGTGPLPPAPATGQGRPPKLLRRDATHRPVAVSALAQTLPATAWRTVTWRPGTAGPLRARFAAVRVRVAHRDYWRAEPHPEEWLLIEWPPDAEAPTKYWLCSLPVTTSRRALVCLVKQRWMIERDYEELKQELGLGHYEGRGWRGFHHHATLCIAAYGFLLLERSRFSPSARAGTLGLPLPGRLGPWRRPRPRPAA